MLDFSVALMMLIMFDLSQSKFNSGVTKRSMDGEETCAISNQPR
ncbi:hypothetical protein [Okeania sp. SIO2C2]|nr:hypothetical protein [Okeania sp. SIO2C2]